MHGGQSPLLVSGGTQEFRWACISLLIFIGKTSPSPSNAWLPKLQVSFEWDAGVSVGGRFLGYFPWKSVTLAFECLLVETLGWYDSFGGGLNVALPGPGLKVGLLGLL
jgi:hypothetical protein